jgi:hypothetical protein
MIIPAKNYATQMGDIYFFALVNNSTCVNVRQVELMTSPRGIAPKLPAPVSLFPTCASTSTSFYAV